MNFDKDGNAVSCFIAPAGSHADYCARSGIPYNEEQESARQALWAWIEKNGQLGTASDSWTDAQYNEYRDLSDHIELADIKRRIEARANGWPGWPGQREHQEKLRQKPRAR